MFTVRKEEAKRKYEREFRELKQRVGMDRGWEEQQQQQEEDESYGHGLVAGAQAGGGGESGLSVCANQTLKGS